MSSDPRPPGLQAILDELQRLGPLASIDDVNRHLAARTRDYNTSPQAELGGLSPDQMSQLLYGDWETKGAVRLNAQMTLDDLHGAAILADARTILRYIATDGPVKETSAKNLPRAAVAALLPLLRIPAQRATGMVAGVPPSRNEGDVRWLSPLRHVLMFAGLLVRRKGLRISARGTELLAAERAGELYALLFRTVFRVLDLRSLGMDDRHAGLQSTVAYSFYKLRTEARDWTSSDSLAQSAWLASTKDPPSRSDEEYGDLRHYTLMHRVLEPLVQFGLLEHRELPVADRWAKSHEYRRTPLFDRLLRFEFSSTRQYDPFLMS